MDGRLIAKDQIYAHSRTGLKSYLPDIENRYKVYWKNAQLMFNM